LTTSPPQFELPLLDPIIRLPALTGCAANATSTTTFTSTSAVRTGNIEFEEYQGVEQGDFWNYASWTIPIFNNSKNDLQLEFPQLRSGDSGSTRTFMVAPSSAAFGLTIPFYWDTRKSIAELYLPLVADGLATGSIWIFCDNLVWRSAFKSDLYKEHQRRVALPIRSGCQRPLSGTNFRTHDCPIHNIFEGHEIYSRSFWLLAYSSNTLRNLLNVSKWQCWL